MDKTVDPLELNEDVDRRESMGIRMSAEEVALFAKAASFCGITIEEAIRCGAVSSCNQLMAEIARIEAECPEEEAKLPGEDKDRPAAEAVH